MHTEFYYRQKFEDDFRELFTEKLRGDEQFGVELWSALANVEWYHESDQNPDKSDCGHSFRSAGSLIASMLCYGDYMDWYCSGPDGIVSKFIGTAMASKGWGYKIYSEPCLPRNFTNSDEAHNKLVD